MNKTAEILNPPVTIIIAVRNEAEHLDRCLRAITQLDYPANKLEFILIDGMSNDNTGEIISKWKDKDNRIRSFINPARRAAPAMNIGINKSKYDLILWISGHVIVPANYLRKCIDAMHKTGAAAVGGVLSTEGVGAIGIINAAILSHPFGVGNAEHRVGGESGWKTAVTMALYKKSAILAAGGFDESLPRNQDNDLHGRMNELGYRSYMDASINPIYLCRSTFGGLLRQAWLNGFWNVMLNRLGRRGFNPRHFVPLIFVLVLIILTIGAMVTEVCFVLLTGILLIYFAVALIVSVAIAIKQGFTWQFFLLPLFFFGLHSSYGLASFTALFIRRRN